MVPIAVFASGRGSNFSALLRSQEFRGEIKVLVTDRPDAPVTEIAKDKIPILVIPSQGKTREEHDREILQALEPYAVQWIVLAGYMRILSPLLIQAFRSERGFSRIVNIHPSLLPAFPGIGSYRQAFEYGAKVTGVTVHLVDEGLDSGPICAQESFDITDSQSAEEVENRGLELEHKLYPKSLNWIIEEKFNIKTQDSGRVHVLPS